MRRLRDFAEEEFPAAECVSAPSADSEVRGRRGGERCEYVGES